jgi:hypothetical protein
MFLYLNKKKSNNPIITYAKDLNRYITKGDGQRANKHRKKSSTSLAIRKIKLLRGTIT